MKYKFYIKFPGLSYEEFTPTFKGKVWEDKLYKDLFYRRNLAFDITVKDDIFNRIWILEQIDDPCTTLDIKVEVYELSTGTFVERYEGYITLKKAKEFNLIECSATFKPEITDIYSCLVDGFNDTIDLFDIVDRYNVGSIIGTLETSSCTYQLNEESGFNANWIDCLSSADGWTLTRRESLQVYVDGVFQGPTEVYQQYTRQYIIQVSQPAAGWVDIGSNKWVSTVPAKLDEQTKTFAYDEDMGVTTDEVTYNFIYSVVDFSAENALSMQDVIEFVLDCGEPINSEFLGFGGLLTAPTNLAYNYATDYLQNILVFHASDIINKDATKNATKFEVKRGELLQDLLQFFNLKLFYDNANSSFILEHVSLSTSVKGVDLVDQKLAQIKKDYKFTRDEIDIPLIEKYRFKFDTNDLYFDDAKIEYDTRCSGDSEENVSLKTIVTNLSEVLNNDEYESNENLLSVFLLATDVNGTLLTKDGILNGPLAFKPIIEALHVYEKPTKAGIVNGNDMNFQSLKKTRKQEVRITLTEDQYHNNYTPYKRYKTQLGWGIVDESKYDADKNELTLKLLQ